MKIKTLLISLLSFLCFISYADCSEKHRHHKHKHKHKHRHHHKHSSKREVHHHYHNEPAPICTPVVHHSVYSPLYIERPSVVQYSEVYRPYETHYRPYETVYTSPYKTSFSFNTVYY